MRHLVQNAIATAVNTFITSIANPYTLFMPVTLVIIDPDAFEHALHTGDAETARELVGEQTAGDNTETSVGE